MVLDSIAAWVRNYAALANRWGVFRGNFMETLRAKLWLFVATRGSSNEVSNRRLC
jgi:hypothetical protein